MSHTVTRVEGAIAGLILFCAGAVWTAIGGSLTGAVLLLLGKRPGDASLGDGFTLLAFAGALSLGLAAVICLAAVRKQPWRGLLVYLATVGAVVASAASPMVLLPRWLAGGLAAVATALAAGAVLLAHEPPPSAEDMLGAEPLRHPEAPRPH